MEAAAAAMQTKKGLVSASVAASSASMTVLANAAHRGPEVVSAVGAAALLASAVHAYPGYPSVTRPALKLLGNFGGWRKQVNTALLA